MTVELFAIEVGHLTVPLGFLLAGREGMAKVPVSAYLIRHPKGSVVFDTGLHLDTQADPQAHIGEFLAAFHEVHHEPGHDIGSRLEAIDMDPASITHVVNSHLHFDHCGGNAQLANATVLVQRDEWNAAFELGNPRGYIAADFDTGQPVELIDGERDLFDDGTVTIFPTTGHTPGHQSVMVRTDRGPFVLCGDACYLKANLDSLTLPGVTFDPEGSLAALHLFQKLQSEGARLMYGHDPDVWRELPKAPSRIA